MITVVGSLKGGSGKSTLAFNLGVWLELADLSVALIDADPQATLSDVVEVRSEEGFKPRLKVSGAEALVEDLASLADEVLIDVGTADMQAMGKALSLADRVVMPVPPSQADVWSAQRFLKLVNDSVSGQAPEIVCFINRGDTHRSVRETDEAAAALISLPGVRFLKARLAQRTVYRRSFSEGLAVFELERRGKGARELLSLCATLYPQVVSPS
ncbi:MAG: AAA family ATPase [Gammaproteobacteria bacterium SHHR-1]|uniref:nucleotide-binding protein n=1 Tax=Magnetovirga frankeli TaxID=947516 RepID=UPI001293C692|nr:AAA family ATPase [gamma proteobacterium SS-5]